MHVAQILNWQLSPICNGGVKFLAIKLINMRHSLNLDSQASNICLVMQANPRQTVSLVLKLVTKLSSFLSIATFLGFLHNYIVPDSVAEK